MAFQTVGPMEPGAVSYQIAVSTAVLNDREDFFSLERCSVLPQQQSASGSISVSNPSHLAVSEELTTNSGNAKHTFQTNKGFITQNETVDFQKQGFSVVVKGPEHFPESGNTNKQSEHVMASTNKHSERFNTPAARNKPYQCSICEKIFSTRLKLFDHKKIHAGIMETPFQCPWCQRKFAVGKSFHKHVMSKHKEEKDAAEICAEILQTSMDNEDNFDNHIVVHTEEGVKQYKCAVCSKSFKRLYRVKEHARTHSGQKPFQCSLCSKTFNSSDILYRHIKKIHNGGAPIPKTDEQRLPETVTVETEFQKPTIIQVQQGPYELQIPVQNVQHAVHDIQFLNDPGHHMGQNLNHPTYYIDLRQQNSHHEQVVEVPQTTPVTVEIPQTKSVAAFQCSECGLTFTTRSSLNQHINAHEMEVDLKCDICSKTFKAESYLKSHMILHSGEKPFKCSLCPKAFYRQYRLNYHMRTHTGEKPYQCPVCGKSFPVSDNMYRHIKKMHGGEGLQSAINQVKQMEKINRDKKYGPATSS